MNHFLLSPKERLSSWKELRKNIVDLPEIVQLETVAEYWAKAPLLKMAYDPDDLPNWPSPWEMVHDGNWCCYSVAVGMEATLRLSGWDHNRLKVLYIRDYDISDQKCVLKIDDTLLLNYNINMIIEYPETKHDVLVAYKSNGKLYSICNK